eukprot:9103609-Heterocapsa_arctica.AAC.1
MIQLHAVFNPQTDMKQADINNLSKAEEHTGSNTDVHTASFPCQPFSTLTHNTKGQSVWQDHRTEPLLRVLVIFAVTQPKSIILGNFPNFKKIENGEPFGRIIHALNTMGYTTNDVVRQASHQHPTALTRLFIRGVRK